MDTENNVTLQSEPAEPIIESASATTSPDNADSGSTAYVIFGVAVALLILLTLGISGCVSSVSQLVSSTPWQSGSMAQDTDYYDYYSPYGYLDDDFGFDTYFDYDFSGHHSCS